MLQEITFDDATSSRSVPTRGAPRPVTQQQLYIAAHPSNGWLRSFSLAQANKREAKRQEKADSRRYEAHRKTEVPQQG